MAESLTVEQFIRKWRAAELKERSAAQEHFLDLCRLLGEPSPAEADPLGDFYCFERGATKVTGGEGWADVWKRGHFGWEYKGKRKNLDAAFGQLQQYALALENPPLLIVCDLDRFVIRTNWTNTVSDKHEFSLEDLRDPTTLQKLKWAMSAPENLRPGQTRQSLTEAIAAEFATLAYKLRSSNGLPADQVAHFINRLVFCMFAEDADLLPNKMFTRMLQAAKSTPDHFVTHASTLFSAMRDGGLVGFEKIDWFNGGLFDGGDALPLDADDIALCLRAAEQDWSEIDPSIFGTLFVRGLDPSKREELGAEYTDRDKIMMIIDAVVTRPILTDWQQAKARIGALLEPAELALERELQNASSYGELSEEVRDVRSRLGERNQLELFADLKKQRRLRSLDSVRSTLRAAAAGVSRAKAEAQALYDDFMAKLRATKVLDPACGSGNFLYLALIELKNLERRVEIEAELLGFPPGFPTIGPEAVLGIEINPYAAELARVSVWIGELQWMRRSGFGVSRDPILKPLANIECRNAIIDDDGTAAVWPAADVIIGNPPYLGAKLMRRKLGDKVTDQVRAVYKGRLAPFTDFVCYWFENSRSQIEAGRATRAGLVATNSIRKNTNLPVLHRISKSSRVFEAWNEEKWTVDGAAVDVSIVCFGGDGSEETRLNGQPVRSINVDLTTGLDMTTARALRENQGGALLGVQKSGPFDVRGSVARAWMSEPLNPNGRSNVDVLKPYWNGDDLTGRPRDVWLIDLPLGLSKAEASLFADPFNHIATTPDEDGKLVSELRSAIGSDGETARWWEPWRPRSDLRSKIEKLPRYIVTAETAQHRIFAWLSFPVIPDKNLIVFPREDDLMFGLLHSRFHELWSLRKGSDLQDRPRYTHTSTFATFPFPEGMTPDVPPDIAALLPSAAGIEAAARALNEARQGWLNPADLIEEVPDVDPRFPPRLLPRTEQAERVLSGRTLTNLYNDPPPWLVEAHRRLDAAVAAAYGWSADVSDEDALRLLLQRNIERSPS